jgi:hypothetical protein
MRSAGAAKAAQSKGSAKGCLRRRAAVACRQLTGTLASQRKAMFELTIVLPVKTRACAWPAWLAVQDRFTDHCLKYAAKNGEETWA